MGIKTRLSYATRSEEISKVFLTGVFRTLEYWSLHCPDHPTKSQHDTTWRQAKNVRNRVLAQRVQSHGRVRSIVPPGGHALDYASAIIKDDTGSVFDRTSKDVE